LAAATRAGVSSTALSYWFEVWHALCCLPLLLVLLVLLLLLLLLLIAQCFC
jgi:hypothetical protein